MIEALSPDRLHVTFCDSGSGALKHWGALTGKQLKHLLPFRAFAAPVGPISLLFRAQQRLDWATANAPGLVEMIASDTEEDKAEGYKPFPRAAETIVRQHAELWRERTTIWYCSRNTSEVSLLSAFLRIGPEFEDADFIDVAAFATHISSLGSCRPEDVGEMGALARRLNAGEVLKLQEMALQASASAAIVRVFEGSEIVEKEVDFLDGDIISYLQPDFQKLTPLFAKFWNLHNRDGWHQLDYFFLLWRFRELERMGRIEWRGFGSVGLFDDDPTRGEVRRVC